MATVENKAAWLEERRSGLGGSDIAKIFGLSKFGNEVDVWLDKRGELPPVEENEAMRLGTYLEPYVADRFTEATGKNLIEYRPTIHGEGDKAFALGNLDRIVVEEGQDINEVVARLQAGDLSCVEAILECKTATRMDDWHDEFGNFVVPEYYRAQVMHYLGLVPSAKRIYVAVFYTGLTKGFEWGCIERNQDVIDKMFAIEKDWWQKHIIEGVMPEPKTKEDVIELFPRSIADSVKTVPEDSEIVRAICDYKGAKARKQEAEADIETAENAITAFLGDSETLANADGTMVLATFKSGKDSVKDVTDWESVAKELSQKVADGDAALKDAVDRHTEFGKVTRKASRPLRVLDAPKAIKVKKVA